jgi:hypothetical protein
MTAGDRALAEEWLHAALGPAVEIETDDDGDLHIDVTLRDGRISGSIASLHAPLLLLLSGPR